METKKSSPDKKEIRKKHLAIRDAMSESEKHEKSRKICDNLLKFLDIIRLEKKQTA